MYVYIYIYLIIYIKKTETITNIGPRHDCHPLMF